VGRQVALACVAALVLTHAAAGGRRRPQPDVWVPPTAICATDQTLVLWVERSMALDTWRPVASGECVSVGYDADDAVRLCCLRDDERSCSDPGVQGPSPC